MNSLWQEASSEEGHRTELWLCNLHFLWLLMKEKAKNEASLVTGKLFSIIDQIINIFPLQSTYTLCPIFCLYPLRMEISFLAQKLYKNQSLAKFSPQTSFLMTGLSY